jgi:hypothetical protein
MVSVFSTVAYIVESNTSNSSNNSIITRGIIACNRPKNNNPVFVNFVSFNEVLDSNQFYFINGKFVNNVNKSNNTNSQELQVNN